MAWYHQFQFAEVLHPLYPKLREIALPILRYEICEDKIIAVEVKPKDGQRMWLDRRYVRLYKAGKDLITIPEQKISARRWFRFLKYLNLKRR